MHPYCSSHLLRLLVHAVDRRLWVRYGVHPLTPRVLNHCGSIPRRLRRSWLTAYCWRMSKYVHKSHNVSVLIYHLVCPATYRRAVLNEAVDGVLRDVCLEIAKRYEIVFLEIGTDRDHVHFLLQSVPTYSPTKIVQTVKSITAREIFQRVPCVKKQLWGGAFWSSGYFINTVGRHGSEAVIQYYVQKQGRAQEYQRLHAQQLTLL